MRGKVIHAMRAIRFERRRDTMRVDAKTMKDYLFQDVKFVRSDGSRTASNESTGI